MTLTILLSIPGSGLTTWPHITAGGREMQGSARMLGQQQMCATHRVGLGASRLGELEQEAEERLGAISAPGACR
ncbi:hypothetical protein P7K49_024585, partial [Saguinus oedipus]